MKSRGTSKSAVSRRFVARTTAQLAARQNAPLDGLHLVALMIDGVHLGDHCLIVALGIAADGQKHALGLWDGSTENATVCQGLLANLQSRGLRSDRRPQPARDPRRLEGAAQSGARIFGEAPLVQRCQVHKMRNILDYLSDRQQPRAQAILRRAYQSADVKTAQRLLLDLARRLETEHSSVAESVREGLDENRRSIPNGSRGFGSVERS
jgi:putative transposase